MATKTIPDLPAATSVVAGTLFPIVNDPAGTPVTQKATGTQLDAYIRSAGGALTATTLDGSGGALTINTAQADKDVVVSSTGMVNLLFTDAGNNRVGINTATPTVALQVVGTVTATLFSGDGSALTSLPAIGTSAFLTVAGNPATPVNANCWYNSTANTFRGYVTQSLNAWAASASLTSARLGLMSGSGTASAALIAGGRTNAGGFFATAEKFNGTSWSSAGSLTSSRYANGNGGTSTSTITVAGRDSTFTTISACDVYNGTSWAATTAYGGGNTAFVGCAGASSSSVIAWGGITGAPVTTSYAFNGSTWTSGGALPVARYLIASAGTATAALAAGGELAIGVTDAVTVYNGTSWSATTSLPALRSSAGGSGTTTASMVYGGYPTNYTNGQTTAYKFDGSTWSTTGSMSSIREELGSAGTGNTSAMAIAGYNGAGEVSSTEIYSETTPSSSKTFTVT